MGFRTLYIIGNGFDLWHRIPSSYAYFKEYVALHDRDLFDAVENYLWAAGENWSDLEASLAELDVDAIIDDRSQFLVSYGAEEWSDAYHHDFQYEIEQVVKRLSIQLRAHFGHWIRELSIPTSATTRLRTIDTEAVFLNFNYTSTLRLYGVPDSHILHIHGSADRQEADLILGHAWNPTQRSSLNASADPEDSDTRLWQAHEILDGFFSSTFKPSRRLIEQHRSFFDGLTSIETVYVLGHSISDVDRPYFEALLAQPNMGTAHWLVAGRSTEEAAELSSRLTSIGVAARHCSHVLWSDL